MKTPDYTGTPKEYIDRIQEFHLTDYRKSVHYSKLLLRYGQEQADDYLCGYACYYISEAYFFSNNPKALANLLEGIKYLSGTNYNLLLIRSYNLIGVIYATQGNIPASMEHYFMALSFCGEYPYMEAILNFNIASIYSNLKDYRAAARYYRKSIPLYKKGRNEATFYDNLIMAYSSLGKCYCFLGQMEKAGQVADTLGELLPHAVSARNLPTAYLFFMLYHHLCGNEELSEYYIKQGIEHSRTPEDFINTFNDYQELCRFLIDFGKYDSFRELFDIIREKAQEVNNTYIFFENMRLRVSYLEATGQTDEWKLALEEYYRLSELQNIEDQKMAYHSMKLRFSYEEALKRQNALERKSERLQIESERDALTGLPNRFGLDRHLDEVLAKTCQEQSPLAIEILDIDCFKQYNDTYGHLAGDECLNILADELKAMASPDVFCARYGGDEFIIIYTHMSADEVQALAENLKESITARKMPHKASTVAPYLTVSQGISWRIPDSETRAWDYLHIADTALYDLKKKCRNEIKIYC